MPITTHATQPVPHLRPDRSCRSSSSAARRAIFWPRLSRDEAWALISPEAWSRRHAESIRHLEFVEADATFFDTAERFDCIVINNVLEYVDDIQSLLRNCRRLLKPRGRLLISTLNPMWTPAAADRRAASPVHARHPPQLRHRPGCGQSPGLERLRGRQVDAPDAPPQEDPPADLAGQPGGGADARASGDCA